MKTHLTLRNVHPQSLPPEFAHDDVRFTEELVEHFLNEFTQSGAVVVDPFAGFGTTVRVAERLGRVGWGLEYNARQADYIRGQLSHPERLLHGDARQLATYALPPFDFSITSPPYLNKDFNENPLRGDAVSANAYTEYLHDLRDIYAQMKNLMRSDARVVIEASNLKNNAGVTTLAWDIAREVSQVLKFEGEVIACWDQYGYGYDHSYCLIFR